MSERKNINQIASKYLDSLNTKAIYLDADQFGDLVDYFFEQGDIKSAYQCIDDGLKIHPESEPLKIKKIKLLAADGNYDKAIYLMTDVSPEYDFDLYFAKLQCSLQLETLDEAELIKNKILEEENDQIDSILIDIAFLYIEVREYEEAISLFQQVKKWDDYLDDIPDFAFCYEVVGEYDKAINLFENLLSKDTYSANYWYNIGRLYALKEDYAKAVDALDFALIEKEDFATLQLKANCLILLDRISEAIAIYQNLLKNEPYNLELYLKLFDSYTLINKHMDAEVMLDKYKEIVGEDEDYFIRVINSLLVKNKIAEAQEKIEEALIKNTKSIQLSILIVGLFISQELYSEAFDYLKDLGEDIFLEEEELLNQMSFLCIQFNLKDKALDYTTRLVFFEPNNKKYKLRLAYLLMEEYDYDVFESYIDFYTTEDLLEIVTPYFKISKDNSLDREALLVAIKNIIENRTLYKSIQF